MARIVESGVPVMGHLGLTPQSVEAFGGHKVQGRAEAAGGKNPGGCQGSGTRRAVLRWCLNAYRKC